MKNGAFVVFKKELARFFGDKRLLFTSVIMPGLLIYLIYSFMGNSLSTAMNESDKKYVLEAVNMPQSVSQLLENSSFEINEAKGSLEDNKKLIKDGDVSLYAVFPEDFEAVLEGFGKGERPQTVPNVEIYYNSADMNSSHAYEGLTSALSMCEASVSNVFDINNPGDSKEDPFDIATKEDTTSSLLSMILPMLLLTFIFSSCMSIAPESIAGEKERGTLAALLITPTPREQIILGKVGALSVMALLGGISSFIGTMLSFPNLLGESEETMNMISPAVYTAADYLWLVVLILTTVLIFITLISIVSAFAKSVKEAGTMVAPLMIVVMLVGVSSMYQNETKAEFFWYLIPVYNTVQSMIGVLSLSHNTVNLAITASANVVYSLIGVFVLTKMFSNEKIIFNG